MKQEHRFVADLYRYLSPFIDTSKELYLSLDGIAARRGVADKTFADADVPDLWFTIAGTARLILLEAKVLNRNRTVTVNRGQLSAWRTRGAGQHKPTAWVAADETLQTFYYWNHADFLPRLDRTTATSRYPKLRMPDNCIEFSEVRQLALQVLSSV